MFEKLWFFVVVLQHMIEKWRLGERERVDNECITTLKTDGYHRLKKDMEKKNA